MKTLVYSLGLSIALISCNGGENHEKNSANEDFDTIIQKEVRIELTKLEFESLDGLMISSILYECDEADAPTIVMCHQARFNKFEYDGIAQRLNEMGYNCIAIDQRSGGPIASQPNETNLRARKEGKGVDYLDAAQDITAAVNFAAEKYGKPVILWGSSYSSTLVLYEAISNENVMAVVSFSPGNYFADELGSLTDKMEGFQKPYFVTSAKNEIEWAGEVLLKVNPSEKQIHFKPEGEGWHGSRALWPDQDGGEEYWDAISDWLKNLEN